MKFCALTFRYYLCFPELCYLEVDVLVYVQIFEVTVLIVKGKLFRLIAYNCVKLAKPGAFSIILSSTFVGGYV